MSSPWRQRIVDEFEREPEGTIIQRLSESQPEEIMILRFVVRFSEGVERVTSPALCTLLVGANSIRSQEQCVGFRTSDQISCNTLSRWPPTRVGSAVAKTRTVRLMVQTALIMRRDSQLHSKLPSSQLILLIFPPNPSVVIQSLFDGRSKVISDAFKSQISGLKWFSILNDPSSTATCLGLPA